MTNDQRTHKDDMPLVERPPSYHSYLLRFWQERSEQSPMTLWRFSLEEPLTDRRYGFPNLEALVAWLQAEMDNQQKPSGDSV